MASTRSLLLTAAALCLAALGGCARTIVGSPLLTDYGPDDVGAEANFWDQLETRSAVTNDEGLHGLLLSADGEDRQGGYDARVNEAKRRGWLPRSFNEPGNMAMQRGTLAVAVCKIAKIKGGAIMRVVGPTQRYATRELVYVGIMQFNSTDLMSFSGLEYVAVLGRMQDYITMRSARATPPPSTAQVESRVPDMPEGPAPRMPVTDPPATPAGQPAPPPNHP